MVGRVCNSGNVISCRLRGDPSLKFRMTEYSINRMQRHHQSVHLPISSETQSLIRRGRLGLLQNKEGVQQVCWHPLTIKKLYNKS